MPDANQYSFKNKELLEILIREAGVNEGRWVLLANFGFAAGNFGPSEDQIAPGAAVVINYMGIQRAKDDTPEAMTLDAAEVNPSQSEDLED